MMRETGVDGVTAARGAIGNPWIFAQARALAAGLPLPAPPSVHQQREVIREHYRLAEEVYGPHACGRQMRKFGIKYAQLHPEPLAGARRLYRRESLGRVALGPRSLLRRRSARQLCPAGPDGSVVEGAECVDAA